VPPQQGKRLLDFADGPFGFCAHLNRPSRSGADIGGATVEVKDDGQ
jgi:hypothetical protein